MSGPFELNEHGLWCPCCGNLIASPATANADDYQAPAECGQCGFPEDADKVAAYHGFDGDDDDDEPDDVCECGDYRYDHPSDGPCNFNKGKGGIGHHGPPDCQRFRLSVAGSNPISPTPKGEQHG